MAKGSSTKLDLSAPHITTMTFGINRVAGYRHMIKGEHLNYNVTAIVRPAPIQLPVFGNLHMNLRAFYCPFRLVFPQFDSMYLDTIGSNYGNSSLVSGAPFFKNSEMASYLIANSTAAVDQVNDPYDFLSGVTRMVFNSNARLAVKHLKSLGYVINLDTKDVTPLSALPLLACCKIIIDWYANGQYLDSSDVLQIRQYLSYNNPTQALELLQNDFQYIFGIIVPYYDNDNYFNSAWDNPVASNTGQFSSLSFDDITDDGTNARTSVAMNSLGTPYMRQTTASQPFIGSQYIHDVLQSLSNFVQRNKLAGSYEIDRWLARYGSAPQNQVLQRSIYVGSQVIPIQIGDVTSTAATAGASVGDYAGKGYGQGNKTWDFIADEMGIFIVFATIIPDGQIWQGIDRNNLHVNKEDFFNEQWDSLGTQAILKREVYVSPDPSNFAPSYFDYNRIFGYCGRYGEYKRPLANVSGDMIIKSIDQGGDAWHLLRTFDDASFINNVSNLHHSLDFSRLSDGYSYHRIFDYTDADRDPFTVFFNISATAIAPCRPLFETYDFKEPNHPEVTLQSNGAKLN